MKKKKTSPKTPKLRHVWAINPRTRVATSKKSDHRKTEEHDGKDWVDELFD